MLCSALRALHDAPTALDVSSLCTIIIFCQPIVFRLGAVHHVLSVRRLLLRIQTFVLASLAPLFHVRRQFGQVLVHLVQRQSKLHAIVGHALVHAHGILELERIGALPALALMNILRCGLGQTFELFGVVFFYRRTLLEKCGKVACRSYALS